MIHSNFSKIQRNVLTDRGLDIKLPDRGQTAAADQFWRPDRRRQKITRCTSLGQNVVGHAVRWARRTTSWGRTLWGGTSLGQYPWGRMSWGSRSVGQDVVGQDVAGAKSLGQVVMGRRFWGRKWVTLFLKSLHSQHILNA